jgi:uncharacterized protein (DUF427 family)
MPSPQISSNSGPGYASHPNHKITVEPSPKRIRVSMDGKTIAESANTLLLRESGYDPVHYFPREDVAMELLERTDHHTRCPFKGEASYWTMRANDKEAVNAVWSYEAPYDEVLRIKGYLAFYPDRVTIREVEN